MPQKVINKIQEISLYLTCFLLPIKLTLGYIGLIPLLLIWIVQNFSSIPQKIFQLPTSGKYFFCLLYSLALLSPFGINPENSLRHIGTLIFFPLTILCISSLAEHYKDKILMLILLGASISCFLRILGVIPGFDFPIIGTVSQSGQLAILIFLSLYFVSTNLNKSVYALVCFILLLLGLILNLKRGPWIGVSLILSFFLLRKRTSYAALFIGLLLGVAFFIPPIYERLASSLNHFFIAGGRSEIWGIGYELSLKYPLGIGFDNSGALRDFSLEIPKNLKHFHSNFLNILVEGGLLSLYLYLGFIISLIKEAKITMISSPQDSQRIFLYLGLMSSLVAGLVEYNFGDSAVISIFYIILGLAYSKTTA